MKKRVAGTNYFAIVRFIILAFIIISIMRFCTSGTNQHRCLQLKIGLDLGYNAVFDFSQPYWRPYVVFKSRDGTPLIDQPLWNVYITDTSIYGTTFGKPGSPAFRYIWRADTGLVNGNTDWKTFQRLVDEAGPANVEVGKGSYGPKILLHKLMNRPEFADQWCTTNFITW